MEISTKEIYRSAVWPSRTVIAGPCSAESCGQTVETACMIAEEKSADIFRAGIWKPRTRPGSFEGMGERAVAWLAEAKKQSGLPVATEVATPAHVAALAGSGVDMLWVGARTATDPFAMQALAEAIGSYMPDIPVFVKNPVNPDIELWIGAMQRLLQAGVTNIGAIHRGFSVYRSAPYRNSPIWQIPIELHRRCPGLAIIHDPSHTGGQVSLIAPLAQKALDMGFSGLMIESHPDPSAALSDGGQQVTPRALRELLDGLVLRAVTDDSDSLHRLRERIDALDGQLLHLLSQRLEVCEEIGEYKRMKGMPAVQPERYGRLLTASLEKGEALGLDRRFLSSLLETLHAESVRRQLEILNRRD